MQCVEECPSGEKINLLLFILFYQAAAKEQIMIALQQQLKIAEYVLILQNIAIYA